MTSFRRFISKRPECESRSQSLRKVLAKSEARGGAARLLPGVLGEVIEELVRRAHAGTPAPQHFLGLRHCGTSLGVRNADVERQALLSRNSRQQDPHSIGDGKP